MGNGATGKELWQLKQSSGMTYAEIGGTCGMSADKVRGLIRRHRKRIEKGAPRGDNDFLSDAKRPEDLTADEWFDFCESTQEFRRKSSIAQSIANATIKTKSPIALTVISDAHIGSPHTNYKALRSDLNVLRENPAVYALIGGDFCDNFIPGFRDAGAVTGQIEPPQRQLLMFEAILADIEKSIVAIGSGNHNDMARRKTGIDTEYFILRGIKKPYLPQGGLLKLTVGGETYKLLWKHNYRFSSSLNQFNSHHRMREMLAPDIDVVITEHEHNPGIESIEVGEFDQKRTVLNVRTGTYKEDDPYSMQFYKAGRRGPQTMIFWPDRHKVLAMHGADALNDAVDHLRGIDAA